MCAYSLPRSLPLSLSASPSLSPSLFPSRFPTPSFSLSPVAFANGQCGRSEKAIEIYEKVLHLYPKNVVAKTTLRMLKATVTDQAESQAEA